MKNKYVKTVLLPINVPPGDYCLNDGLVCSSFDNEGGYPRCSLDIGQVYYGEGFSVLKCKECKGLRDA